MTILWIRSDGAPNANHLERLAPYGKVVAIILVPEEVSAVTKRVKKLEEAMRDRKEDGLTLAIIDSQGYESEIFLKLVSAIKALRLPILALLPKAVGRHLENRVLTKKPRRLSLSRLGQPQDMVLAVRVLLEGPFTLRLAEYTHLCRELHVKPVSLAPARFRGGKRFVVPKARTIPQGKKPGDDLSLIDGRRIKLDPFAMRILTRIMAHPWALDSPELMTDPLTKQVSEPERVGVAIRTIRIALEEQGFAGYSLDRRWNDKTSLHSTLGLVFIF